jgi:hypothetical protein
MPDLFHIWVHQRGISPNHLYNLYLDHYQLHQQLLVQSKSDFQLLVQQEEVHSKFFLREVSYTF